MVSRSLEGPIPVSPGKVEVTIRPLSRETTPESIWSVIGQSIVERSKREIDRHIHSLQEEGGSKRV